MATAPRASALSRHMANRFSYGWTPALERQMRARGGPQAWFEWQLQPEEINDPVHTTTRDWWASNRLIGPAIWARHEAGTEPFWKASQNYQRWAVARRIYSQRQLLEVMSEFWENHLHVPCAGEAEAMFRADYGRVVQEHALGRFVDLLHAAITHPAMGCYLNNASSTAKAPNEDLGRELLEVHTVGRGSFGEDDVKSSARILTGWRVDLWRSWNHDYDPDSHWTGAVSAVGFRDANTRRDGRDVTRRYLEHLARHPVTAQHIARKLAVRFVSDAPPAALVDRLAQVYLENDTAIRPVLRALVASPEFPRSAGAKVRTPDEDVVATYRVMGVTMYRPTRTESAANTVVWQSRDIGLAPFAWPRPDGRPDHAEAWSSTARVLASLNVHWVLAGGWWPRYQIRHRAYRSWLPGRRVTFRRVVDHVSHELLGRPATAQLVAAAAAATECRPREIITPRHSLTRWKMPRLIATVLDTPDHLSR